MIRGVLLLLLLPVGDQFDVVQVMEIRAVKDRSESKVGTTRYDEIRIGIRGFKGVELKTAPSKLLALELEVKARKAPWC